MLDFIIDRNLLNTCSFFTRLFFKYEWVDVSNDTNKIRFKSFLSQILFYRNRNKKYNNNGWEMWVDARTSNPDKWVVYCFDSRELIDQPEYVKKLQRVFL